MAQPHQTIMPVLVSTSIIRSIFNNGRYLERLQRGVYRPVVIRQSNRPAPPWLPRRSVSQMVAYLDLRGERIAIVHQYLQPDGTLGAGGLPDPKWLVAVLRVGTP